MYGSYLIGLREGLEITLVVSILIAFLVKSERKHLLKPLWIGVAAAVVLAVAFAELLNSGAAHLSGPGKELFDAIASLFAVVFVTWMIFWMRRMARRMGAELRGKLEDAIKIGPLAVAGMAFLSVVREGMETAVLFFAYAQGASDTAQPLVGLALGMLTAIVLGWLLYASVLRINLTVFFTWTGVLLVLVAAGIFKYGVHDLQESNVLPGLYDYAFNLTAGFPPDSWYAELLRGMFNFTPQPTVLETIAWVAYGIPVLVLFLLPLLRRPAAPKPAAAPVKTSA